MIAAGPAVEPVAGLAAEPVAGLVEPVAAAGLVVEVELDAAVVERLQQPSCSEYPVHPPSLMEV